MKLRIPCWILCLSLTSLVASSGPNKRARFAVHHHPCLRECKVGERRRVCRYKFTIEQYWTMGELCYGCPVKSDGCQQHGCIAADGWQRGVVSINRQIPGPTIHVCQGDLIIVDLHNKLVAETTTIHWHGVHQVKTPFMDGVPMVTQYPIQPGTTFQYRFEADVSGTMFYHSHSGFQRDDGQYGGLIIRQPKSLDPNGHLYDYDLAQHHMILNDWAHITTAQFILDNRNPNVTVPPPLGMLVNGHGMNRSYVDPVTGRQKYTPVAFFQVREGKRFRFRVISNAFSICPIEVSVDGHKLLIIATDGSPIEPMQVDSFVVGDGERFDFVLHANQRPHTYWMKFRGLQMCAPPVETAFQYALLKYEETAFVGDPYGEVSYQAAARGGRQLNTPSPPPGLRNAISLMEVNSKIPDDISLKPRPDYQVYLYLKPQAINILDYPAHQYPIDTIVPGSPSWAIPINGINFAFPTIPPLLEPRKISERDFCNNQTLFQNGKCVNFYCTCTHKIDIPLNSVVELILVNEGSFLGVNHPFHLHGNYFRLVAMQRTGRITKLEEVMRLDRMRRIPRKLRKAAVKDTLSVPDSGYVVLRFHANNPGYWLFHCHISLHAEKGMMLIFKVGEDYQMKRPP